MHHGISIAALACCVLCGCPNAGIEHGKPARKAAKQQPAMTAMRTEPASDGKLEIRLVIEAGAKLDRVPTRTATLHFKNVSKAPLRVYLPVGEPFRANISTLVFAPEGAAHLVVPESHPHGYVVTERDFHLVAPGASVSFAQPFTIDPFVPGPGNRQQRLSGFEPGKPVPVRWTYENTITRWKGGLQTLDGPTRELFGGQEIPFIWTGELTVRGTWTAPPP